MKAPPDIVIEKLLLGELDAETAAKLRRDPAVVAREEALRASNEEILRTYPPERMARQLQARARAPRPLRYVAAVAAACAVAFLLVSDPPTERIRGAPSLAIYRQTGGEPERLHDGSPAKAGDVLQIMYSGKGARYGCIVSIDGRDEVTWHLLPSALHQQPTALPAAYELDDAPKFERFELVTSAHPFTYEPKQALAAGLERMTITLVKP